MKLICLIFVDYLLINRYLAVYITGRKREIDNYMYPLIQRKSINYLLFLIAINHYLQHSFSVPVIYDRLIRLVNYPVTQARQVNMRGFLRGMPHAFTDD